MVNRSLNMEDQLVLLVHEYYEVIIVAVLCVGATLLLWKLGWRKMVVRGSGGRGLIPGRLGLPFLGESIALLSATSSTKGCYDFVRLRRLW